MSILLVFGGSPKSTAGPPTAPRPFSRYRDTDDIALSIFAHHEHTNIVGLDMSGVAPHSSSRADSATMTAPDLTAALMLHPDPSQSWTAPRTPFPFNRRCPGAPLCPRRQWKHLRQRHFPPDNGRPWNYGFATGTHITALCRHRGCGQKGEGPGSASPTRTADRTPGLRRGCPPTGH